MVFEFLVTALASLFTIINPFSTASVYASISRWDSHAKRKEMALRACLVALLVLYLFAFTGTIILEFFGITIDAFRIAGGILIVITAMQMLRTSTYDTDSHAHKEATKKEDIAIIPLAIPMLSGPGAITTTIVLMSNAPTYIESIVVLSAIAIVLFIAYFVLSNAQRVTKYLGHTGNDVLDKIMGIIVLVVGIQFVLSGLGSWLSGTFGL